MRKSTFFWLLLAALAGGILFHTSQQVTDGRAKLQTLAQNIREEQESIRVLNAEWSYLNRPARLEKLSAQYLTLAPLTGRQMTDIKNLTDRPQAPAPTTLATAAPLAPQTPLAPHQESFKPQAGAAASKPASPAPAPAPKPAAQKKITPPVPAKDRSFSDVMKSLGLRHAEGG